MVLKRIVTRNIQSHREVVVDLPPTGLVVFAGNNSNGKSVIVKTTKKILTGELGDPRSRASTINRNAVAGEIEYTRDDGAVLLVHIQREANATYVDLELPGEPKVRRYLSDKSYQELIYRFGFVYDKQTDIAIQIAEAEEALLFYKTPHKTNGAVLSSATTDQAAETAAENITETIKEVKHYRDVYETNLHNYVQTAHNLKIEDTTELNEKIEVMQRCYRNLQAIYFPTLPEVKPVPVVKFVSLHIPKLPEVKYPRIYSYHLRIPDILPVAKELEEFRNQRCPTCGRRFDEHESLDSVHQ